MRHNVTWNAQALGVTAQSLPSTLPFLSCPSTEAGVQQSVQTPAPSTQKTPHRSQLTQPETGRQRESYGQQNTMGYSTSIELLEAACNESIPSLTGISNFTVFLYCKLFEGKNGSVDPAAAQMDLHATCSDAAWYLSAAEEDFFWVHVCSEFFAREFNNTVCANTSFWLQRANQVIDPSFSLECLVF